MVKSKSADNYVGRRNKWIKVVTPEKAMNACVTYISTIFRSQTHGVVDVTS